LTETKWKTKLVSAGYYYSPRSLTPGQNTPMKLRRIGYWIAGIIVSSLSIAANHGIARAQGEEKLSIPVVGVVFPEDEDEDAWLKEVKEGGPAEKAGLKPGDTIIKFNDQRVKTVEQFRDMIRNHKAGEVVKLSVRRGKEILKVSVRLEKREG
jgi:S1-C subfamily serine protease